MSVSITWYYVYRGALDESNTETSRPTLVILYRIQYLLRIFIILLFTEQPNLCYILLHYSTRIDTKNLTLYSPQWRSVEPEREYHIRASIHVYSLFNIVYTFSSNILETFFIVPPTHFRSN